MKRLLPFSLILASAALAHACSSSGSGASATTDTIEPTDENDGEAPVDTEDAGDPGDGGTPTGTVDPSGNPILLGTPAVVRSFAPAEGPPDFVDGPVWTPSRNSLFITLPYSANLTGGKGVLASFQIDGTIYTEHRVGDVDAGTGAVGNTVDKDGNLLTAEQKLITRTALPSGGVVPPPTLVAGGYGDAAAPTPFDGPNDLVVLSDGTIYVTDPGYNSAELPPFGHLYMIAPGAGVAQIAETYANNPAPNGIAVSKDEKSLFVGFTQPAIDGSILPFIRKYAIGPGGTLTDQGKLLELPVDSAPDGIAVDERDNIYVALKTGIAVFNSEGVPYGGASAKLPQTLIPSEPTGLAFGGPDRMSLFVTTKGGKVLKLRTAVAGLLH